MPPLSKEKFMKKKILSIILAAVVVLSCFPVAFAADTQASLYDIYGDAMLFEQEKDAVFAGKATSGAEIEVILYNGDNEEIAKASSTAADGVFEVSFTAPSGSFEEYTAVLTADGAEFDRLERVVFGELWIASGQSNMMYPLGQSRTGREMLAAGKKFSPWLRVLIEPAYPEYNGSDSKIPLNPQEDIKNAFWVDGENSQIYNMSAVGFFFAAELMERINMPVGILNSSLGGSSIVSWISRQKIDNNAEIKGILEKQNRYVSASEWNEDEQDIYGDMTANYNLRTYALRRFRPSGVIWYQGETDLMFGYTPDEYAALLDLLQEELTDTFCFEDGLMPFIYTQLAGYFYSDDGLNLIDWNINYAEMQAERADSRALVTIYDLLLTYIPEAGFIHPERKEEIGERMAFAAENLAYGKDNDYSAAYMTNAQISGNAITVTFANAGDGLTAVGGSLKGFAVCGKDGIYVPAKAEITGNNTVKICSEEISNPVSASYAYCVNNQQTNLFSTVDGIPVMPASPFVTARVDNAHYWIEKDWTDCESPELFRNLQDGFAGFSPVWNAENAEITFESASAHDGKNGIKAVSQQNNFTVSPVLTYADGENTKSVIELDRDYSDYGIMSVYIRNNGASPVSVTAKLSENSFFFYNPMADEDMTAVIPADGEWHKVEFDLNALLLRGNEGGAFYSNNKLDNVKNISFEFACDGNADISLDCVEFTAQEEDYGTRFISNFANCDSPLEFFCSFFTSFISLFANLFS